MDRGDVGRLNRMILSLLQAKAQLPAMRFTSNILSIFFGFVLQHSSKWFQKLASISQSIT